MRSQSRQHLEEMAQCTADYTERQNWNILAVLSEDGGLELSGLKCTCKGGIRILCAPVLREYR